MTTTMQLNPKSHNSRPHKTSRAFHRPNNNVAIQIRKLERRSCGTGTSTHEQFHGIMRRRSNVTSNDFVSGKSTKSKITYQRGNIC